MMSRANRRRRGLLLAALVMILLAGLSSCSRKLGWGLVLWTAAEGPVPAGSVVPVYIRSNINQVYVVGSLDGKKKIELPFWQVELYGSRSKAKAAAGKFAPVASLYLVASRDGLPVRDSASNAGNRVFRLHEGQSVKVLEKVKGEEVRTGDTVLQGDWYFVLTDDGTRGYVFSNTMSLFDESTAVAASPETAASSAAVDVKVDNLFARAWRPEYFQSQIDDSKVDLDTFDPRFGLFADAVHRQIRIELPGASEVFQYTSIAEEGGAFVFEGSPLRVRFQSQKTLVADWTGIDPSDTAAIAPAPATLAATAPAVAGSALSGTAPEAAASPAPGASGKATFVVVDSDVRDVIRTEQLRRQKLLLAFLANGSDWTLLASDNSVLGDAMSAPASGAANGAVAGAADAAGNGAAGNGAVANDAAGGMPSASRLILGAKGRFAWSDTDKVPAGYLPLGLPPGPSVSGDVALRLYLDRNLQLSWQGVISFRFDNAPGSTWVDFLYRMDGANLVLAPVASRSGLEAKAASPLLPLSFAPSGAR
jgi:hypothetical protein